MNEWATRIKELEAVGLSLVEIGETIGLSTSSVSDIKRGATKAPNGMAAVKLHELHRERCPDPPTPKRRAA
jgi:hypothetical protein